MTITLQQIQERAYATAKAKGWHEHPLREQVHTLGVPVPGFNHGNLHVGPPYIIHHDRVLAKHALMHTELTEAHECIENDEWEMYAGDDGKIEGLSVEIADCIIRICDTTAALGLFLSNRSDWLTIAKGARPSVELQAADNEHAMRVTAILWLGHTRRYIDQATEAARVDSWDEYTERLTQAVIYAASIVAGFGLNLVAAIEAKMDYNETRPHRHGGKRA
jgi:hypothetical protein